MPIEWFFSRICSNRSQKNVLSKCANNGACVRIKESIDKESRILHVASTNREINDCVQRVYDQTWVATDSIEMKSWRILQAWTLCMRQDDDDDDDDNGRSGARAPP